jgi:hypothetical protein
VIDSISSGMLVSLACLGSALLFGVGFAIAICRGARYERNHRTG